MNRIRFGGLFGHLEMVLFGYRENNVYNIRHAAGAFAALVQLTVNQRRNDDAPRVLFQQTEDDLSDLVIGDDIALTDEHRGSDVPFTAHQTPPKPDCQCQ
ncbi:hypothetical protein KBY97_14435 [Synechococcus sp. ATX 2A4]|uniref:hypothetical protein n=1 Tax=Synechococcus sp. ATX 2A4 TaxID=2823727 RepID=UPI0020CBD150|nr:hypothetical protein [Synechococcus sp. ATX 2A4]MCP9886309.1 hypothetical protein [Synechococcus sp. ATX 2A4]